MATRFTWGSFRALAGRRERHPNSAGSIFQLNTYVYYGGRHGTVSTTGLRHLTGYTAGTVSHHDVFFWRDAPLTRDEVHDLVASSSITNLSDTPDTLGAHGELLGVNAAGDALVFSALPLSWAVQIDTELVPELNQDAISVPRLVLEDSGLTHYLAFLDWTAENLARINHLPVGGHIGLRQGVTTRILRVVAAWDAANDRYQVINVNTGILSEAASGTDTELLLTAQSTRETVLFGRGEPPPASTALVGMRYLDLTSKVEYGCFDDPHRTSESTGDFDDINRSDITINLVDRLEDIPVVENEWLYRIAANRFYAATDVGAGVFRWVDDTADDALAGSLVTSTDEVVWLGRHIDNEEALRGLTAIETGKEYFFYREQDGDIVRLDNSSFTAAGSSVAHPFWFPIKADDREEHIFNARDGLPALANDGSDDNRIGVVNDGVYIVDVDPINATAPTADSWADYADTDYQGAFASDPTIDTGEWYANYTRKTFREFESSNFGLGWVPHDAPDDFIGWYTSRQDALNHAAERGVASGGDFTAFTGADSDPAVETATNFTPATSARVQRNWRFVPVSGNDGTKADADLGNISLDAAQRTSAQTELGLGTAAIRDTGTAENDVPILGTGGLLAAGVIPTQPDNYVDTLTATIAGNDVTIELGRTGTLSSLSRSFTVPGTSGGGSSVGVPDIETLFDNFPSGQDSGTALPAITDNDAPNWTPNGHTNVPLGKALTSADDDKFLMVDWSAQYTFGSDNHQVRRARWVIPADLIRGSATNTETTGDAQVDGWIAAISRVDSDHDNSLDDNDARLLLLSRGRDGSDHDRLRIIYGGGDDNDVVDTTQIYVRAELVPQVAQSRSIIQVSALPALADASVERIYSVVSTVDGTLGNETLHYVRETNPHIVVLTAAEVDAGQHGYSAISSGALRAAGDIHPLPDGVQQLWSSSGSGVELIIDTSVTDGPFADETDSLRLAYREHGSGADFTHVTLDTVTSGGGTRTFRSSTGAEGDIFSDLSIQYDLHFRLHGETESVRLYDDKHYDRILTRDLLNEELVEVHDALSEKADDDLGNISLTDAQKGTVRPALGLGGVTHIEGGATYNNNVITVSTTEVVRGGDGILFAVPSPFGTSATQAVSLAIDGQANSEHPLHDRNGDAIHEADLTVNSVYIAISDASSWDILVLPAGDAVVVQDEGVQRTSKLQIINFTGTGVQASGTNGTVTVNIGDNAADNEVQVASSPLWQSANTRIQVTLDKHPADGDIFSFVVPSDIDTTSTTDLSLRVTDGSTLSAVRDLLGLGGSNLNPADLTASRRIYVQRVGVDYVVLSPLEEADNGVGEIILEDTSFAWVSTSPAAGDAATTMFRLDRPLTEADHGKLFAPSIRFEDANAPDASRFPLPPIDAKFVRALVDAQTAWPGGGNPIGTNIDGTPVQFLGPRFWTTNGFGHAIWNLYYTGRLIGLLSSSSTLGSTTLTVTATAGLSAGDHIFLDNERIEITSVNSATQLTVVATTAAHSANVRMFRDDGRTYFFTQTHNQQDSAADIEIVLVGGGAASEGGQESPGTEGVTALTANLVRVNFWKWVLTTDGKPADPTAHWRFDNEWDGTTPAQGGGWYVSQAEALDVADNNPAFSQDTWTLWSATEQTRRRVVNDAYSYTDGGYTVTAVWDIQYSTDDGSTWTTTEPTDVYHYIRYRDQETGEWGPIIPVGTDVGNNDWQPIRTNDLVYPGGSDEDELQAAYDFGDFSELLFVAAGYRSVSVPDGMGGTMVVGVNGPWHQCVVSRGAGWPVADASDGQDNNDENDGPCFQFTYFATNTGVGFLVWERGDDYVDFGNPPFLQDSGEPPRQMGGHFKIVSTDGDEAHVTKFRFFDFSHDYARMSINIFARYR